MTAEWIFVKDQLPNENQYVLVVFENGAIEVAERVDDGWWTRDGLDFNYGFDVPVAWAELPAPPEAKP